MTREIKFRGKDILTDKWVYGDLLHLGNAYAIVTSYEEEELKVNPISDRLEIRVEDIAGVYPETVGQLTGQLDKNKKEPGDYVAFTTPKSNTLRVGVVIETPEGKIPTAIKCLTNDKIYYPYSQDILLFNDKCVAKCLTSKIIEV